MTLTPPTPAAPPARLRARLADLVNVPYADHGTDLERDGGLNCYGLVRAALSRYGIQWPEDPAQALRGREALARLLESGERPTPGDVVEMCMEDGAHLGMLLEDGYVLHAIRGRSSAISRLEMLRRMGAVTGIARPLHWQPEIAEGSHR